MRPIIFPLIAATLIVASCAGRAPDPVALIQPTDTTIDCVGIKAEVTRNNKRVKELAKEKNIKLAQNVAAGVGGLFLPIVWFGLDFQGTQTLEMEALQDRQKYLADLSREKSCK